MASRSSRTHRTDLLGAAAGEEPLPEHRPNMAERPDGGGKSFDIDGELGSRSQSASEANLFTLSQITDRRYIPFPITDEIRDPERIERLCISPANKEYDGKHHNSSCKSSEFMTSGKHNYSDISSGYFSVEYPSSPINIDKEPKSGLHDTSYRNPELKDSPGSCKSDQTMSLNELKGKHSDLEEIESGLLEMTSDSNGSAPVTNVSQLKDYSVHLSKAQIPAMHEGGVSVHTREARTSYNSADSPPSSISRNTNVPRHVTSTPDFAANNEKVVHEINTLRNENFNLQKEFKKADISDTAMIGDDSYVFRIQELESYLTEPDQLYMQEQRLKNRTAGVQMAIKLLRLNEQCLKDVNFCYREQISRLKTEKNFLQLRLSKAEQDEEEYVQEIRTITDKCEELLNQRKHYHDERNHLFVEKHFLVKEIEDLKREKKRNADLLALVTAENDKLVKMLNSRRTMLFTYAKEKQELLSRLKEALVENSDLKRKINASKTKQVKE
ncbi:uncharacterized protein LOC130357177 isoform X3 [Hyla sarda]|uniref:uncharacterized protein LOC130357177 isoform X3 n=1 Tax=Hyla sarda TaxID=327740 RepID=UPI0024C3BF30|nr:uncharacterized protein LOC130357177 isoform X3 [Hyla sarda]